MLNSKHHICFITHHVCIVCSSSAIYWSALWWVHFTGYQERNTRSRVHPSQNTHIHTNTWVWYEPGAHGGMLFMPDKLVVRCPDTFSPERFTGYLERPETMILYKVRFMMHTYTSQLFPTFRKMMQKFTDAKKMGLAQTDRQCCQLSIQEKRSPLCLISQSARVDRGLSFWSGRKDFSSRRGKKNHENRCKKPWNTNVHHSLTLFSPLVRRLAVRNVLECPAGWKGSIS